VGVGGNVGSTHPGGGPGLLVAGVGAAGVSVGGERVRDDTADRVDTTAGNDVEVWRGTS